MSIVSIEQTDVEGFLPLSGVEKDDDFLGPEDDEDDEDDDLALDDDDDVDDEDDADDDETGTTEGDGDS